MNGPEPTVWITSVLAAVLAMGLTAPSYAQNASTDSTQIEQRIEETTPRETVPKDAPTPNVDQPDAATPEELVDAFSFVLSAVVIAGATVFTPEDLAQHYEDFLAKSVDQNDVSAIAKAITDHYRDAGYALSRADVPEQEIVGGVLHLSVTEGYVEEVIFEGDVTSDGIIRRYAEAVLDDRPTRLPTIERALLLVNDLSGVTVKDSRLSDGSGTDAKVLTVVLEQKSLDANFYVDNRGSPSSGRWQSWTAAGVNGVFDAGDRLQIGLFTIPDEPEELVFVQGKWLMPVGGWGATVEVSVSGSVSDAGSGDAANSTETDTVHVTTKVRQPVVRTREQSLWVNVTLDYLNSNEDTNGTVSYEDRNRTARLGVEYFVADVLNGDLYAQTEYSRGIGILNASESGEPALSRTDGSAAFDKLTMELRRFQNIVDGLGVQVQAKGQWANKPLLSSEEFSVGGGQYGRAFDYGEISGEKGGAGLVELSYTEQDLADWLDSLSVYAFYDAGAVWFDGGTREFLSSAGAGVRGTVFERYYWDGQMAKPLTRVVSTESDKAMRLLFSIGAGF